MQVRSGRALQVVQEIKVMRSGVTAREKERAERATLVQQEKLSKAKVLPLSRHSAAAELCHHCKSYCTPKSFEST